MDNLALMRLVRRSAFLLALCGPLLAEGCHGPNGGDGGSGGPCDGVSTSCPTGTLPTGCLDCSYCCLRAGQPCQGTPNTYYCGECCSLSCDATHHGVCGPANSRCMEAKDCCSGICQDHGGHGFCD